MDFSLIFPLEHLCPAVAHTHLHTPVMTSVPPSLPTLTAAPSLHLLVPLRPRTLGQRQLPQGTGEAEMGTVGEEEREAEAGAYRVPITGLQ